MIRAFIFDLDGLLIDSEPFWRSAERIILNTVDIIIDSLEKFDDKIFNRLNTAQ